MRREGERGGIILDKPEEHDLLWRGIEETGQGYLLGVELLNATTVEIPGSQPETTCYAPLTVQELEVTSENSQGVRLALYGILALNGIRGLAVRLSGEKRLARRILKVLDLPFDGSLDGKLLH